MIELFTLAVVLNGILLSEEIEVKNLGMVPLSPNEWSIETTHFSEINEKSPDVVVLKRRSNEVERVTILRYRGLSKPQTHYSLCDSIADSNLFGIPNFLARSQKFKPENKLHKESAIEMVRLPLKYDADILEVTNIYTDATKRHWMNHGLIANGDNCVFVVVHTANRVLSPEFVRKVYRGSKLQNSLPNDK